MYKYKRNYLSIDIGTYYNRIFSWGIPYYGLYILSVIIYYS